MGLTGSHVPIMWQGLWYCTALSTTQTHPLRSKSASHWPARDLRLLTAPLSDILVFTWILKAKFSFISPGCIFIRRLPLEWRLYIPSPTQSILDNETQPFCFDLYALKLLPTTVFSVGLLPLKNGCSNILTKPTLFCREIK